MDIDQFLIFEETTIYDAASLIDQNSRQIAFVVRDHKLVAALSDGDIRRHILRNGDFSRPVKEIANYDPKYLMSGKRSEAQAYLYKHDINALPILNGDHEIIAIEFRDSVRIKKQTRLGVPLVIMAGGKGSRLAPYTDVLPKPLIPVSEKTITEHILDRFEAFGCDAVYMIVNYKKELIKAYFAESPRSGSVRFVEEPEFWGTGGGLRLLKGLIGQTFFLSNCDILVDADYEDILRFHREKKNIITMVLAMKKISVAYGTVQLNEAGEPLALVEKPEYPLLTNTGFYVIEPEFIEHIPAKTSIGITDVIQRLIDAGLRVGAYPVSESAWKDMGEMSELHKMRSALLE